MRHSTGAADLRGRSARLYLLRSAAGRSDFAAGAL